MAKVKISCQWGKGGKASSLPPEILGSIFHLAVEDDREAPKHTRRTAPINISMVSKHWRSVAINYRRLWQTIRAFLYLKDNDELDLQHLETRHIPLFLKRSGPFLPIDFSVVVDIRFYHDAPPDRDDEEDAENDDGSEKNDDESDASNDEGDEDKDNKSILKKPTIPRWVFEFVKCFEFFEGHYQRVQNLKIIVPIRGGYPSIHYLPLCKRHVRSFISELKTLKTVYLEIPNARYRINPFIMDVSHNPDLLSATLKGCVVIGMDDDISLDKITHLDLSLRGFDSVRDTDWMLSALARMTNLSSLCIETYPGIVLYRFPSPTRLPNLKSLRLANENDVASFMYLLQTLTCPVLEDFAIICTPRRVQRGELGLDEFSQTGFGLPDFFRRSRCSLKSLEIDCCWTSEYELLYTLRMTPELLHLAIHSSADKNGEIEIEGSERIGEFEKYGGVKGYFRDDLGMVLLCPELQSRKLTYRSRLIVGAL